MVQDVEKAALGMNPVESKITTIPGDRIFGPYREGNIIEGDRNILPEKELEIRQRIKIIGQRLSIKIVDSSESKVTIDTNHPLTTKTDLFHSTRRDCSTNQALIYNLINIYT